MKIFRTRADCGGFNTPRRAWNGSFTRNWSGAPHTPPPQGMLNEGIFRAMKPTAYFINVWRGKLVDAPALVRVLKGGGFADAGLDVVDPELFPVDDYLGAAGNVIITSHFPRVSEGSTHCCYDLL